MGIPHTYVPFFITNENGEKDADGKEFFICSDHRYEGIIDPTDEGSTNIAEMCDYLVPDGVAMANAQFIILATNNHQELVDAVEEMIGRFDPDDHTIDNIRELLKHCKTVYEVNHA